MSSYDAIIATPFAQLGIRTANDMVTGIDYLPRDTATVAPHNPLAAMVARQIDAYLRDPDYRFSLPLAPRGTPFQLRVWDAIAEIRPGQLRRYGELAKSLHTAARAVGQACGANPLPLVIPCHRVVGAHALGGFNGGEAPFFVGIKRWLLAHERAAGTEAR